VPVFSALTGIPEDEIRRDLPEAALGTVDVDQWIEWLESKGAKVLKRYGCPSDIVPCAHLVAPNPPRNRSDFHWIYRDEDGDVHDPSSVWAAMPADDVKFRDLAYYEHKELTISISRA